MFEHHVPKVLGSVVGGPDLAYGTEGGVQQVDGMRSDVGEGAAGVAPGRTHVVAAE